MYTSRYTFLFIELLSETADRTNFELLARKVRKKAHDFYKHTIVWTDLCTKYLKVCNKIESAVRYILIKSRCFVKSEEFPRWRKTISLK